MGVRLFLLSFLASVLLLPQPLPAEVRTAPAAPGEVVSERFTVSADGQNVPVYAAKVSARTAEERRHFDEERIQYPDIGRTFFGSFDLRGSAVVTVTCSGPVREARLMPASAGVVPAVSGNTVTFAVSKPGPLCLEVDGDWVGSLALFVNPWQEDVPREGDPNVVYFGPGVHRLEGLRVLSGKTVYVADGAVLYGLPSPPGGDPHAPVVALKGDHIAFRGRGILDGSLCPPHTRNLFEVAGRDISVEGVILRDSSTWTMPIHQSDRVSISNVKIFGYRANSDGIDICNSRDVDVTGCFLRTYDDLIVVKTNQGEGPAGGITATRCVLWNEIAHALSLGAELREDVDGVRFADCDIIRDKGREWLLRVYQCDAAHVRNVVFEDIRIEEARRLFSAWIGKAVWSAQPERGHVDGVTFRRIRSVMPLDVGSLEGFDADHAVRGVRFEDVLLGDRPLRAGEVRQNGYVSDVVVVP